MAAKEIITYRADQIDSLNTLERSCGRDEAQHFSKITKLELATNDGVKVTAATYEETDDMKLGQLAIVQYETDVDEQSQMAIHKAQGETFMLKGNVYVNSKPVKVLVFRKK